MTSTPWFVGGGAEHSPEVARLLAFAGTGGAEGIVTPGDYKVTALPVPAGSVRIGPGAGLLLNRSAGASQQTYASRRVTTTDRTIDPTGSAGGRSDLIVQRIEDPQYSPWPARTQDQMLNGLDFDPFVVLKGIPAGTKSALELNLGYPVLTLARVDIPASTGAITDPMIKDLRKLAQPRSVRQVLLYQGGGFEDLQATGSSFTRWPNYAPTISVPSWATHVIVQATLAQVSQTFISGGPGGTFGNLRLKLGAALGPNIGFDVEAVPSGTEAKHTMMVPTEFDASAIAGTDVSLELQGAKDISEWGFLRFRGGSTLTFDLTFVERAV